jgi:hypothetical protein
VPLADNELLLSALSITWLVAAALLGVPVLARLLGQAAPTALGAALALRAFPLVLVADASYELATRPALPRAGT